MQPPLASMVCDCLYPGLAWAAASALRILADAASASLTGPSKLRHQQGYNAANKQYMHNNHAVPAVQ